MNNLSTDEQFEWLPHWSRATRCESTTRMPAFTEHHPKIAGDLGRACSVYQDRPLHLKCKRIQCDEIWSFVGARQRTSPQTIKTTDGRHLDWVAMDAETKLVPCWFVGNRDGGAAYHFMLDIQQRLAHRVQLTTMATRLI